MNRAGQIADPVRIVHQMPHVLRLPERHSGFPRVHHRLHLRDVQKRLVRVQIPDVDHIGRSEFEKILRHGRVHGTGNHAEAGDQDLRAGIDSPDLLCRPFQQFKILLRASAECGGMARRFEIALIVDFVERDASFEVLRHLPHIGRPLLFRARLPSSRRLGIADFPLRLRRRFRRPERRIP